MQFLSKDDMFVQVPSFNEKRIKVGSFAKVTQYYEFTGKHKDKCYRLPEPKQYNGFVSWIKGDVLKITHHTTTNRGELQADVLLIKIADIQHGYYDLVVFPNE